MADAGWDAYLAHFHADRPGITERALTHARDPSLGTAYEWLLAPLPRALGAVLDVACGSAVLQAAMVGRDRSYLGVDISEAELRGARDRGRGPVVLGDARALPVADGAVDTVVSSLGLMLVRPLSRAIGEIARVLRPGGHAAVLLPAGAPLRLRDLPALLALHRRLRGAWAMPQRPSAREARREMDAAGLRVLSVSRHRFPFALRSADDARLAVASLYTPGRVPRQLAAAESALMGRLGPRSELPVPLLRIVARRR